MARVSVILLSCAFGLLMATGSVAESKTHDLVAAIHLKAEKFEAAEEALRKALAGANDIAEAHRLLGLI